MSRQLIFRLVLPIVGLILIAISLNQCWPAQGFFINLATELIGIVVTIAYVDWLIRKHEQSKWSGTEKRVRRRIQTCANSINTRLRRILGVDFEFLENDTEYIGNPKGMELKALDSAMEVLRPAIPGKLNSLNQEGWRDLAVLLEEKWDEIDRLIDRFGYRLSPDDMELLLDLQNTMKEALFFWEVFPFFAGVPDEKLPHSKSGSIGLKREGYKNTAEKLSKIVETAVKISRQGRA